MKTNDKCIPAVKLLVYFFAYFWNLVPKNVHSGNVFLKSHIYNKVERSILIATHNQVRMVGFLLAHPKIINEGQEGAEKAIFRIRTTHRDVDIYNGQQYQDVMIYYDGIELMPRIKKLQQFDLIDIKGVFNILTVNKKSNCPGCGQQNVKYRGSSTFIYPISLVKLNAMREAYEHDPQLPLRILEKHFKETSNQVLIVGTVVSQPEMIGDAKHPCCRYRLGVDRKYYIKTQSEITADYPWVYSYGQQAEYDYSHLKMPQDGEQGSLVLVDGFVQYRDVEAKMVCDACGEPYTYHDIVTEFIPYSIEYLNNYITDEEIAKKREIENRLNLAAILQG